MWVFGYGSLMWDGWENQFRGVKHNRAKLNNYHRDFIKGSTRNWGTPEKPCPTFGLEAEEGTACIGCAFEFEDSQRESVLTLLRKREGRSFQFIELNIELEDGTTVKAITPVNQRHSNTYIGNLSLTVRADMAKEAQGEHGKCYDYIKNLYHQLNKLGIKDEYVERMWRALH